MTIKELYKLCYDAYTGGGGFLDGSYLQKFKREGDFADRQKNSSYTNHMAGLVSSITSPVFGDKVTRTGSTPLYDAFTKNCNRRGMSLTNWLQEVSAWHAIMGTVFIIMDNASSPPDLVSEAISSRAYPYVYYKLPGDVYNVVIDDHGGVKSITFSLASKEIGGISRNINRTITDGVVTEWYEEDGGKTYIGDPIQGSSMSVIMTGSEPMPLPPFGTFAQVSKKVYNIDSEQRNLERAQAFALLQLPGDVPAHGVEIGVNNCIFVPFTSQRDAKYISPDPQILQVLSNSAERVMADMKEAARNLGVRVVEKHYKSGDALSFDYVGADSVLAITSELFESIEYKIRDMFSLASGLKDETKIEYSKDYLPSADKLSTDYGRLTDAMSLAFTPEQIVTIREMAFQKLMQLTGGDYEESDGES